MYRLTALLLLLFLFSCGKNPVDTKDQPKATGKITIVCTTSPTVAAKPAAEIQTTKAKLTVLVGSHLTTYDLVSGTGTTFETPSGGVVADAGANYVTVTGYDSENRTTWFGAASCVVASSGPPTEVSVTLFDTNTVPSTVSIPGGTFMMGQTGVSEPVHAVTLSAFEMSVYETTQGQYSAVMTGSGENPSPSHFTGVNLPVEQVSWWDAIKFCNALSAKAGLTKCYTGSSTTWTCNFNANGFRLPTEAEWECACRGGNQREYGTYDGSISTSKANYNMIVHKTTAVGSYPQKNSYGLYDMSGNVFEWCNDWYGTYPDGAQENPTGALTGTYRVARGGGWTVSGDYCRSAAHYYYYGGNNFAPGNKYGDTGFRVVRRVQ